MAKPIILLVDDEKTVLNSVVNQLRYRFGFQYKYEPVGSVSEAWQVIRDSGSDVRLIISDWMMPGDKGDKFLIEVSQEYPDLPQIMLSGFADEDSVERARQQANLQAYIRKPWDEQELLDAAAAALGDVPAKAS